MNRETESKEFLLMKIESTAMWRGTKSHEFPESSANNLNSQKMLLELYKYVEGLPDNHQIFYWYIGSFDEEITQKIERELRMFGYQNQNETSKEFINRLVEEGINEGLIDNILDRRKEFEI